MTPRKKTTSSRKNTKRITKSRDTGRAAGILENAVDALISHGFKRFTFPEWRISESKCELPNDYVVRSWPHKSLYGGGGKKEALIFTQRPNRNEIKFICKENKTHLIVETKYQGVSGSVDEKLPYVWEAFLTSNIPNWILLYAGDFWHEPRGIAAIKWLKERIAKAISRGSWPTNNDEDVLMQDKSFRVVTTHEFMEMIERVWR